MFKFAKLKFSPRILSNSVCSLHSISSGNIYSLKFEKLDLFFFKILNCCINSKPHLAF